MKKLLFIFSFLAIAQIYAMEENPNVQWTQKGGTTNFSLTPVQVPEIKIQECTQCGKEALKKCTNCKFTYYCSPVCQKSNWSKHKSVCREVGMAQRGDLAHMRNIFSAYMKKASQTSNKQLIREGLSWHCRTLIRLRQDMACSKDSSTQSSIERVKSDHTQMMQQLVAQNICTQEELEDKEIFKDALAWVKAKTKEKEVVPPFGIRRYGLKAFMNAQMDVDDEFFPENEWHAKRMDVLRQYEEALQ